MQKLIYLINSVLLISLLGLLSCSSDDDDPAPTDDDGLSTFRVEYSHSGDLDKFVKSFTIGSEFVFTGTQEAAPATLFDDELVNMAYSFTNSSPVEEIEVSSVVGWIPIPGNDPAEIKVTIAVYRDEDLLETKEVVTTHTEVTTTTTLSYSGK